MSRIQNLPDPPEHLESSALELWQQVTEELFDRNRLTKESLDKISDLCYWESERENLLQLLHRARRAGNHGLPAAGGGDSALFLSSLKAVQQEMDEISESLGLETEPAGELPDTPPIPGIVYQHLPDLIGVCCNQIEDERKRDLFLLSSLPVIASHLVQVTAEYSGGHVRPGHYSFVMDSGGTASGMPEKARRLGQVLHNHLLELDKSTGQPGSLFLTAGPEEETLFHLLEENGGHGLLILSDLTSVMSQKRSGKTWQFLSNLAERSYRHEPFRIPLATGTVRIEKPNLSMLLSGSVTEFRKMVELSGNEISSLFALYSTELPNKWQSPRPDRKSRVFNEKIGEASRELAQLYQILAEREFPLHIDLTDNQWQMVDDTFAEKMQIIEELDLPGFLHLSNRRAALLTIRFITIFSLLRSYDDDSNALKHLSSVTPDESDMIAALWLVDTCLKHAIRLFRLIPEPSAETETDAMGERFHHYYSLLPIRFETSRAVEVAERINIPPRTAKRYLARLTGEGLLIRLQRGVYKKAAITVSHG
ncbi:MAG: DUF3987 domain-containing protein [Balneolaceae bacterium]